MHNLGKKAHLLQRNSVSAVHVCSGRLTDRAMHWTMQILYN